MTSVRALCVVSRTRPLRVVSDGRRSSRALLRPSQCLRSIVHRRAFSVTRPQPVDRPSRPPRSASHPPSARNTNTNPFAPTNTDRGPQSKEDTQTDFGAMDIYSNVAEVANSVDACTTDGFHLNNGVKITGGAGVLLAGGESWSWKPWLALGTAGRISDMLDPRKGILNFPASSWGLFNLLYPKPDLLIIGTGSRLWMLSPETKRFLHGQLGLRVDVMDTANASAAYNLLAKERGVEDGAGVGGAFLPIGWKGPEGAGRRR